MCCVLRGPNALPHNGALLGACVSSQDRDREAGLSLSLVFMLEPPASFHVNAKANALMWPGTSRRATRRQITVQLSIGKSGKTYFGGRESLLIDQQKEPTPLQRAKQQLQDFRQVACLKGGLPLQGLGSPKPTNIPALSSGSKHGINIGCGPCGHAAERGLCYARQGLV